MYSSEIHRYLNSLIAEPYCDWEDLSVKFLETFNHWILSTQLNEVKGLDLFPYRDFCLGVTHSLDDLHIRYNQNLVALKKEYKYHWRIRPNMLQKEVDELSYGDVLVLSLPFAFNGSVHPEMKNILNVCKKKKIPLHIDSAWFGTSTGLVFDYSHPCIESVTFSLSKGLGLGQHRAGVRYSKKREAGPVTVINDYNYYVRSVMWIGLKFMHEFSPDYFQNLYKEAYEKVCKNLCLKKSPIIFLAYEENENCPVGIRPLVRWVSEGRY